CVWVSMATRLAWSMALSPFVIDVRVSPNAEVDFAP
ncbi:MAG: hypothetical protein JWQ73_3556, partial [Variovorax sp.]|nr:hypothetical protein [Variovorax sp.]